MKKLLLATLVSSTPWAMAHEGHGLQGSHWHATDAWGWAVLGVALALVFWSRRGK